jgi:biopolymer transport protein ExbD
MEGTEQTSPQSIMSWLIPVVTISLVVFVQAMFWLPSSSPPDLPPTQEDKISKEKNQTDQREIDETDETLNKNQETDETRNEASANAPETSNTEEATNENSNSTDVTDVTDMFQQNNTNNWRCACEGGFLPPGMLKSFGSAEAMIRLGTGQCYHKQA